MTPMSEEGGEELFSLFQCTKYLIEECHCDLLSQAEEKCTSLHLASKSGELEIVDYLIFVHHCDPNVRDA